MSRLKEQEERGSEKPGVSEGLEQTQGATITCL